MTPLLALSVAAAAAWVLSTVRGVRGAWVLAAALSASSAADLAREQDLPARWDLALALCHPAAGAWIASTLLRGGSEGRDDLRDRALRATGRWLLGVWAASALALDDASRRGVRVPAAVGRSVQGLGELAVAVWRAGSK